MRTPEYPAEEVRAIFTKALGRPRPLKRVTLYDEAQKAADALVDVLDRGDLEPGDRVALEDARAVLERYATDPRLAAERGPRPGQRPTPAQRRALLEGIDRGGRIQIRVGASASRMRAYLLQAKWSDGLFVTDAGYEAVGATRPRSSEGGGNDG